MRHRRRRDLTRGRSLAHAPEADDLVPQVCAWFEDRDFERVWLSDPEYKQCCGAHRFTGTPSPLEPGATMFTFNRLSRVGNR